MAAISANDTALPEMKMRSPHENLTAAIGMIQSHILASESSFDAARMFGQSGHYAIAPLEAAVAMLVPLAGTIEDLRWDV